MNRKTLLSNCSLIFVFASATALCAADGFTVQGSHSVKLKPQRLRLTTQVSAQGSDAKDALEKLHKHESAVKTSLTELKADPKSISFTVPKLKLETPGMPSDEEMQQNGFVVRQRMLQQMMERTSAAPSKEDDEDSEELPKIAIAVSVLTVEWSLPDDADTIARLPLMLEQKLKERDIAGKKNKFELSEDAQQKIADSIAAMQGGQGNGFNAISTGYDSYEERSAKGLRFEFVSNVNNKDLEAGAKAAFELAAASAALWSKATGLKLGKMKSVSTHGGPSSSAGTYTGAMNPYFLMDIESRYLGHSSSTSDEKPTEAVSKSPDELEYVLNISITYAIGE